MCFSPIFLCVCICFPSSFIMANVTKFEHSSRCFITRDREYNICVTINHWIKRMANTTHSISFTWAAQNHTAKIKYAIPKKETPFGLIITIYEVARSIWDFVFVMCVCVCVWFVDLLWLLLFSFYLLFFFSKCLCGFVCCNLTGTVCGYIIFFCLFFRVSSGFCLSGR